MRKLIKTNETFQGKVPECNIYVTDEKWNGAHHRYEVEFKDADGRVVGTSEVNFQKGGFKDIINHGPHHEDYLLILIHRLDSFQNSEYKCDENEDAISYAKKCLESLRKRTRDRIHRGVEGIDVP